MDQTVNDYLGRNCDRIVNCKSELAQEARVKRDLVKKCEAGGIRHRLVAIVRMGSSNTQWRKQCDTSRCLICMCT